MDRKIRDFMKGRYGIPDELYKFLFILLLNKEYFFNKSSS